MFKLSIKNLKKKKIKILGNQQSSLVGQMCFQPGQAKNTYRSGCFLLCNIGEEKKLSTHGLVTTIAYKFGKNKPAVYAMEGSVAVAGSALNWLKNNMGLLKNTEESEQVCFNNLLQFVYYL